MQHIGTITFGIGGVKMGLYKYTVHPCCDTGTCNGLDHIGPSPRYSRGLIGLLQGMGDIQDYRGILLHGRKATEIHDHILVTEHGTPVRYHNLSVMAVQDLMYRMLHAFRTHKLPFF